MNGVFSGDNITLLFSYPFKDPAWKKKLLLGFIAALVPFMNICLMGYAGRMIKPVADEGRDPFLPEWDDWGGLFIDGLRMLAVTFLGILPSLLFVLPAFVIIYASMIVPAVMSDSSSADIPVQVMIIPVLGMLLGGLLALVGSVISMGLGLLLPAALCHVVVKHSLPALFQFREWWAIWRANLSGYLLCMVMAMGLSFAMTIAFQFISFLVFVCFPLYFIAVGAVSVYFSLLLYPLFAQVYREGVKKLAAKQQGQA